MRRLPHSLDWRYLVLTGVLVFLGAFQAWAQTIRLCHNGHLPKKVLVCLTPDTLDIVANLIDTIAEIHKQEGLVGSDAFKLYIFVSSPDMVAKLPNPVDRIKQYCEFETNLMVSDFWMQDMGEFCAIERDGIWREGIFDSRRGRGLAKVMPHLANIWQQDYLINPSTAFSAGDYGGNIEVTPENILYYGDTMTSACESFLLRHGYSGRAVKLETSWLRVGHVDEYVSFIPNRRSPCGYSIVKADPSYALELLESATDEDFAHFCSSDRSHFMKLRAALRSPAQWANTYQAQYIQANREITEIIDRNVAYLIKRIRTITQQPYLDIPVVSWPTLFCHRRQGKELVNCIADLPGVANHVVLLDHLIVPEPRFPPFQRAVEARFRAQGNKVHFINNRVFHQNDGQIHCGTNVRRDIERTFITPQEAAAVANLRSTFDRLHRDAN